jgi:hypothetical protein
MKLSANPRITFLFLLAALVWVPAHHGFGQQTDDLPVFSLKGYVKGLQNTWVKDVDSTWTLWNNFHNRLDFNVQALPGLSLHAGLRTQFLYGGLVEVMNTYIPDYASLESRDVGFFDLTAVLASGQSYILKTQADRLFAEYSAGKLNLRLGRQRINWGMGLVWNPNDIFNAFSYFDFDYEERPGSDAIRAEYYTGLSSSIQAAMSFDHTRKPTAAAMYRFTYGGYDIQLMGGKTPSDWVIGSGWAGDIRGAGFRGEASYFVPCDPDSRIGKLLLATAELDYTFRNSLYVHGGFLYNSNGTTGPAGQGSVLFGREVSARFFTPARYSVFSQISYPFSPILTAGLACIFNPGDYSVFINPSVDLSVSDNWQLLLTGQIFTGDPGSEFGGYGGMAYLRLKYSF